MTAVALQEIKEPGAIEKPRDNRGALATTDGSIVNLLQLALEKGTPVEQLEKLVDLHERMEARHAAREFAAALAAFQAECPSIKKNKTGKVTTKAGGMYEFTYADLDETVQTVRPYASKQGLSFTWDHVVAGTTLESIFVLRHVAGHAERTSYVLPIDNPSGMSPQQKVGAAQTFADRRSLMSGLGLTSSDEDAEGEAAVDPAPISEDQALVLSEMLAELGASTQRFLKFMEAKSIEEIRAADYDRAIAALDEMRVAKEKRARAAAAQSAVQS